ncbi:MAG TPA: hypothetical protein DCX80_04495 [Chloroflexi bacterium]|nr:hypothetical protein [Chloroflexota bacterium]
MIGGAWRAIIPRYAGHRSSHWAVISRMLFGNMMAVAESWFPARIVGLVLNGIVGDARPSAGDPPSGTE